METVKSGNVLEYMLVYFNSEEPVYLEYDEPMTDLEVKRYTAISVIQGPHHAVRFSIHGQPMYQYSRYTITAAIQYISSLNHITTEKYHVMY